MANRNITLKRNNAGTTEELYPTTDWAQVNNKPSTFTPTAHDHTLSDITDAGTVAAIDLNSSTTQYLRGDGTWQTVTGGGSGLTFEGTLAAPYNVSDLAQGYSLTEGETGNYWIVSTAGVFSSQVDGEFSDEAGWDDGVQHSSGSITLEVGDWIVLTGWVNSVAKFGVINNNDARFASYVAKAGDTMSGNLTMGSNLIYGDGTTRYLNLGVVWK